MNKYFFSQKSSAPNLVDSRAHTSRNNIDKDQRNEASSKGNYVMGAGSPRYQSSHQLPMSKTGTNMSPNYRDQPKSHLLYVQSPSNHQPFAINKQSSPVNVDMKSKPSMSPDGLVKVPRSVSGNMGSVFNPLRSEQRVQNSRALYPEENNQDHYESPQHNLYKPFTYNNSTLYNSVNTLSSQNLWASPKSQKVNSNRQQSQHITQPTPTKLENFVTRMPQNSLSTQTTTMDDQRNSSNTKTQRPTSDQQRLIQHRSLSPPQIPKKYYSQEAFQSLTQSFNLAQPFRENINQNYQCLKLIQQLSQPTLQEIEERKAKLPQTVPDLKYKKTVVFDLDETLVHCNTSYTKDADIQLNIVFPTGEEVLASIYVRPFAVQVLKQLSKLCEVIIFTASHSCYASKVVQALDPKGESVSVVLDRSNCIQTKEGVYVKDLRVLDRDLKDLVLVDNALYSFGFQLSNGIPIVSYYEGKEDQQLLSLYSFLINEILPCKDVRPVLTKYFQLNKWMNFPTARDAVLNLYDSSLNQ